MLMRTVDVCVTMMGLETVCSLAEVLAKRKSLALLETSVMSLIG